MPVNRIIGFMACAVVIPLASAAVVTRSTSFNVSYEVWSFEPVGCFGGPAQNDTFLTNECTNLDAYFGKFTLDISNANCTLHFWNQTGCEGQQGPPISLIGEQETDCEPLIVLGPNPRLIGPGNPARETAKSVKVTCPSTPACRV